MREALGVELNGCCRFQGWLAVSTCTSYGKHEKYFSS